ncbi:MAG: hypothetical protein NC389_17930, partial [Acetatifactor muris]|nr:hypothetical protein [Acetatifactor muris]
MKKKRKLIAAVSVILVLFAGLYIYLFVGAKNHNKPEIVAGDEGTDALVVYFTRSGVIDTDGVEAVSSASLNQTDDGLMGNTQLTANAVCELTGADMFEIQTDRYYRKPFMGTAATAWLEEKLDLRPELAGMPENLDKYNVIYVGYPIWWFNAPMAVGTFLESY